MNDNAVPARTMGRVMRFLLGIALAAEALRHMPGATLQTNLAIAGVVIGLTVFYTVAQMVISRYRSTLNRWLGTGNFSHSRSSFR